MRWDKMRQLCDEMHKIKQNKVRYDDKSQIRYSGWDDVRNQELGDDVKGNEARWK